MKFISGDIDLKDSSASDRSSSPAGEFLEEMVKANWKRTAQI